MREAAQRAGVEAADLRVPGLLGLVHGYKDNLAKEALQRFLCNEFSASGVARRGSIRLRARTYVWEPLEDRWGGIAARL
ncbi:hypothetical protein GCM10010266_05780 [Streptomyces griseomycini]|nr:hypothetical protein GCM10010266_05780 [Streptomyces griseomycini]